MTSYELILKNYNKLKYENENLQQELTTLKQEKEELNAVCRVYEKGLNKKKNQITTLQQKIDKVKEYCNESIELFEGDYHTQQLYQAILKILD